VTDVSVSQCSGLVVSASDCDVTATWFESCSGRSCLSRWLLRYAVLGTGCTPLLQCMHRLSQLCIPPGSLNRIPASEGIKAGMSPLPGGREHCVIPQWHVSSRNSVAMYTANCYIRILYFLLLQAIQWHEKLVNHRNI